MNKANSEARSEVSLEPSAFLVAGGFTPSQGVADCQTKNILLRSTHPPTASSQQPPHPHDRASLWRCECGGNRRPSPSANSRQKKGRHFRRPQVSLLRRSEAIASCLLQRP